MPSTDYQCEQCGREIRVRASDRFVVCGRCGAEQRWAPMRDPDRLVAPPEDFGDAPSEAPLLPIPDNLDYSDDGHQLTIRRRWFRPMVFGLVFFCIAWDSFLVFWYSMAFGANAAPGGWGG